MYCLASVSRRHAQYQRLPISSSSRSSSLHFLAFRAPFPRASDQEMGFLSVSPVSAALQGPQVLAFFPEVLAVHPAEDRQLWAYLKSESELPLSLNY